jgi:uncharacterized protein (TIGR00156 family)
MQSLSGKGREGFSMKRIIFLLGAVIVVLLLLVSFPPGMFIIGGIHMTKHAFFLFFCVVMLIAAAVIHAQGFMGPGSFPASPPGGPGFGPPSLPLGGPGFGPPPPGPGLDHPPIGQGHAPLPPPIEGSQGWYGFTGPVQTVTIEQVKTFAHRTPVIVTGTIVQAIGGDSYLFRDSSGEIMLKIGPNEWYTLGSTISPSEKIEISGEVHRDFRDWQGAPEIHTRYIRKL